MGDFILHHTMQINRLRDYMKDIKLIKRDGKEEPFNSQKIRLAVEKAGKSILSTTAPAVANLVALAIQKDIVESGVDSISVEEIQDKVEEQLVKLNEYALAKEYITFRKQRNDQRYLKSVENKIISDLISPNVDNDFKRENANIDAGAPMGTMLKVGSTVTKEFYLKNLVKPIHADMHRSGLCHMHDLDFAAMTINCVQIPLDKLLKRGFNTGHGCLRSPTSIGSAATLMCIAVQSSQNDFFGGQSIPALDYYLAPYVAKSYVKNLATYLEAELGMDHTAKIKELFTKPLMEYVDKYEHIMGNDHKLVIIEQLNKLLYECNKTPDTDRIGKMIAFADERTDRDTYQAMEATVHNLCTLNCLPGDETMWIYDTHYQSWVIMSIEEVYDNFRQGRFYALSVNPKTGETEMKPMIAIACNENNTKQMVKVTDVSGRAVRHTFDHKHMTVTDDCKITYAESKDLKYTTVSRDFKFPTLKTYDIEDVSHNSFVPVNENTIYKNATVEYTEALAELCGIYVGDGSIAQDFVSMSLGVDTKISLPYLEQLFLKAFGFIPKHDTYCRQRKNEPDVIVPQQHLFYIGVHLGRMFAKMCSRGAENKHIPNFVMHGTPEIQNAFLRGYLMCDGCRTKNYIEFGTISGALICDMSILFASRGELMTIGIREVDNVAINNPWFKHVYRFYTGIIGKQAAIRLGIEDACNRIQTAFEIPKYNLQHVVATIKDAKIPWGDLPRIPRRSNSNSTGLRYWEMEQIKMPSELKEKIKPMTKLFRIPVRKIEYLEEPCETVYDISIADNENFVMSNGLVIKNSRAGSQVPFSSLNTGTDITIEGRMVTKNLFLATEAGLGNGETPIFPISIMKLKKGITDKGSPNYDLFKLACRVSSKRLFPNFSNLDAPMNLKYYKPNDPNSEVAVMGCRTRVVANVHNPKNAIIPGRGNLFSTTLSLPYLALLTKRSLKPGEDIVEKFFDNLYDVQTEIFDMLMDRFNYIKHRRARNFPFMMGQNIYVDSERLHPDDEIEEVIKNGTIVTGFIGLAECLKVLTGKHHGESKESNELGLKIIKTMHDRCMAMSDHTKLNFSFMAAPAEGCCGRLLKLARQEFGVIEGVTDHEYLVNSFHVPPYYPISAKEKIDIESEYHQYCPAGVISYVELDSDISMNTEAFEQLVDYMAEKGMSYFSINHPVDRDPVCGYIGIIGDRCPRCGRKEGEDVSFEVLKKLSSYTPDPKYTEDYLNQ